MKRNYEVLDTLELRDKHYVTLRVVEGDWEVSLYRNGQFGCIELAEIWRFSTLGEDDALDCFCRFIPEYLEEVGPVAPNYATLLKHKTYRCREHMVL